MKTTKLVGCLLAALTSFALNTTILAQANNNQTESGKTITSQPLDGLYASNVSQRLALTPHHVEERDVFWEKKVWREIDVREMRNHHFIYPQMPFINVLLKAVMDGDLTAYSTFNDEFTTPLDAADVEAIACSIDTIYTIDPITFEERYVVVKNEFDPASVVRYRVKEVWYFDSRRGQMDVRILGIAPIITRFDDNGNPIANMPLFWIYMPEARALMAKEPSYNKENDVAHLSWDDIFESRLFSSYITKESNAQDKRLQDMYSGIDLLLEADKIQQKIFHFEHDVWTY